MMAGEASTSKTMDYMPTEARRWVEYDDCCSVMAHGLDRIDLESNRWRATGRAVRVFDRISRPKHDTATRRLSASLRSHMDAMTLGLSCCEAEELIN